MNAKLRLAHAFALTSFVGAAVVIGCGVDTAVVGGECRVPYVACGHECVDLENDPAHCGACDVACASGVACVGGTCGGTADGGGDGATSDANASDGAPDGESDATLDAPNDGTIGDGALADGSDGGAGDGSTPDGGANDGAVADAAKDAPSDAPPDAPLVCTPPKMNCGGVCIDVTNDGDNCGACNRVCASNICINGVCQGAASGDIVYIGHDYATTPLKTSQARLLENAVLLAPRTPVRVLAYQRYATAKSMSRILSILADAQTRTGRTIQVTSTSTDATVAAVAAANYDVVLVPDQVSAPAGTMATLGASWSTALAAFTHVGGVFVVLDGDTGPAPQMHQFATATGLLAVTAHAPVAVGDQLAIIAPTDALAQGVVTPFAMRANTCRFATEPNGGRVSWVVNHVATGTPNVVHKIAP